MIKILFICHGNICRSVGAQYILQDMINRLNVAENFFVDSAATTSEEIGNPIYPQMERALREKHIPIGEHRARRLEKLDYDRFDLLIGMDEENLHDMRRIFGGDPDGRLHYLMEYSENPKGIIDDPWYTRKVTKCTGEIMEGCEGLLRSLV